MTMPKKSRGKRVKDRCILKVQVQVPLFSTGPHRALIYDKSGKNCWQLPLSGDLSRAMDGEHKKFFHAEIVGKKITLVAEAAWQNW